MTNGILWSRQNWSIPYLVLLALISFPSGARADSPKPAGTFDLAAASTVRVICVKSKSHGTGFFHHSGALITAAHVVAGCAVDDLMLLDSGGRKLAVSRIAVDDSKDLALLFPEPKTVLPSLPLATAGDTTQGCPVTTWGYPYGYNGTLALLSKGFVAGWQTVTTSQGNSRRFVINAAFNLGNSGGPLLRDNDGQVIGVVISKLAPIPPHIEIALKALAVRPKIGEFMTAINPDGTKELVGQGEVIAEVLRYLRSQTQLVVGYAAHLEDLQALLRREGIVP